MSRDNVVQRTRGSDEPEGVVAAVLVAVEGELTGAIFAICPGRNELGRAETSDVVLPSIKISRSHAVVICEDGVFAIAPRSDRNPTRVNGEPTEGTELNDGDLIQLGHTTFRFRTIQGV